MRSLCSLPDCGRPHSAKGYCNRHYQRLRAHGDPSGGRLELTVSQRFERLVDRNGPESGNIAGRCWLWTQKPAATGYGDFRAGRRLRWSAHRYSYELYVGPIPDDLVLDHLCRNRICVNPTHLELVTNEENLRRGAGYGLQNGMRNHCANSHEYTPENTYIDRRGGVRCRQCARDRDRQPHRLARKHVRKAA